MSVEQIAAQHGFAVARVGLERTNPMLSTVFKDHPKQIEIGKWKFKFVRTEENSILYTWQLGECKSTFKLISVKKKPWFKDDYDFFIHVNLDDETPITTALHDQPIGDAFDGLEDDIRSEIKYAEAKRRRRAANRVQARVGLESLNPQTVAEDLGLKVSQIAIHGTTIDVDGTVNLTNRNLERLPYRFGVVTGSFWCYNNLLTSLDGAPQKVGGSFSCSNNRLTSLEGAPREVGESFFCNDNRLTSLDDAPLNVGEDFWCHSNRLTSLDGAPQKVGGGFWCNDNRLTSLEGAPQKVGGSFWCADNPGSATFVKPRGVKGKFNR